MSFYFYEILIFCIILFIYIHINYQLTSNSDLEIYEINEPSKNDLESIFENKQPVLIKNLSKINDTLVPILSLENMQKNYGFFDINISNPQHSDEENNQKYLHITLDDSIKLFKNDKTKKFISQNNNDFLNETTINRVYKNSDQLIKPSLLSKSEYDYIIGDKDSTTKLQRNLSFRNFFIVTSGSATVKLVPPEYTKYLREYKDYENFEFTSPLDVWNIQEKYQKEFQKTRSLEIKVNVGDVLFIPSYWWYSIKMNSLTSISVYKYWTYMNHLANLPHYLLFLLQNQNISNKRYNDISEKINTHNVTETIHKSEKKKKKKKTSVTDIHNNSITTNFTES